MKEITEDYVSYETAVLLKAKGFIGSEEIGCTCGFYSDTTYQSGYGIITKSGNEVGLVFDTLDNKCVEYNEYLRPTINIAMKWLREEHKLFIDITAAMEDYIEDGMVKYKDPYYTWEVFSLEIGETLCFGEAHNVKKSYEEACESAIKYCLENLIE